MTSIKGECEQAALRFDWITLTDMPLTGSLGKKGVLPSQRDSL
jgi:hypothetical protein